MTEPTVLVVEDDWLIATDIASQVAGLGLGVRGPASDVRGAFDQLRGDMPAAALLDVSLGQETSFPVADFLIEHEVPFAFVTSYPREALPLRYEGCQVVRKPFSRRALTASVKALLASAGVATRPQGFDG